MAGNIGHDSGTVRATGEDARQPFYCQATDGDERSVTYELSPFPEPIETLRRPGHPLQGRWIDRSKSNIVRIKRQGTIELGMTVSADTDSESRLAQRWHIGRIQVALSEMHKIASCRERTLPMVVDYEASANTRA
jgi:hypothetical protein